MIRFGAWLGAPSIRWQCNRMLRTEYTAESSLSISKKSLTAFISDGSPENSNSLDAGEQHLDPASILQSLGIGKPHIALLQKRAEKHGSTLEDELLVSGLIDRTAYYNAIADIFCLPFLRVVDPDLIRDQSQLDTQLREPTMLRLLYPDQRPAIVLAPQLHKLEGLRQTLRQLPGLRDSLLITTPKALCEAVWKCGQERRVKAVSEKLFETAPRFSSRITLHGMQGFYLGIIATACVVSFFLAFEITLLLMHVVISTLYLVALQIRFAAMVHKRKRPVELSDMPETIVPVYTVMVALYKEEAVTQQLLNALDRLKWPKSRLDIKLVCEADDEATIRSLEDKLPGPHFEIVRVPAALPRTKPKALSYALSAARGDFVAIYDAEDRPHPEQLREAYSTFKNAPSNTVCLQAPLIITNAKMAWLSTLFSLEYSALFRRMLPMLSHHGLPLPLGGTSNHFKTDILKEVGGWDPYNVTEDADIGMRLYRLGYRTDVIRRQTLEDAPTTFPVWLAQRSRWYKGWLQTWLVMMRSPLVTAREMGWKAYAVFHLLIGGMLVSSLTHPFIFIFLITAFFSFMSGGFAHVDTLRLVLFCIDSFNILGSYASFILLGRSVMTGHEKDQLGKRWLMTPFYWMALSIASWRAVIELKTKPFFWNKTPHKPIERTTIAETVRAN